jgi:thiamine pyrophosphokinase
LVIAADGGYRYLQQMGLNTDLVIGDFDSMSSLPRHPHVVVLPKEKDDTDMAAAIQLGLKQGCSEFRLYGGTGGRESHTLANFQCLVWLARRGLRGVLVGTGWEATAVTDGVLAFSVDHRGYISVFCQGDRAEGVTLHGLKYPLNEATLTCDIPLGVSNEFTGVESSVAVRHGTLLVLYDSRL